MQHCSLDGDRHALAGHCGLTICDQRVLGTLARWPHDGHARVDFDIASSGPTSRAEHEYRSAHGGHEGDHVTAILVDGDQVREATVVQLLREFGWLDRDAQRCEPHESQCVMVDDGSRWAGLKSSPV